MIITDYHKKEAENHLDELHNLINQFTGQINKLKEENTRLKSEAYKDEELATMQEQLKKAKDDYYRGFPISESDATAIRNWQTNHTEKVHKALSPEAKLRLEGVSGGRWMYTFVPTSIGTFGTCRCGSCYTKAFDAYHHAGKNTNLADFIKKYDAEFEWDDI